MKNFHLRKSGLWSMKRRSKTRFRSVFAIRSYIISQLQILSISFMASTNLCLFPLNFHRNLQRGVFIFFFFFFCIQILCCCYQEMKMPMTLAIEPQALLFPIKILIKIFLLDVNNLYQYDICCLAQASLYFGWIAEMTAFMTVLTEKVTEMTED